MCIYEAFAGEPPYADVNVDEVKRKIAEHTLPPRPDGMKDGEWALIKRMTRFNPKERISMAEVVARLKSFAEDDALNALTWGVTMCDQCCVSLPLRAKCCHLCGRRVLLPNDRVYDLVARMRDDASSDEDRMLATQALYRQLKATPRVLSPEAVRELMDVAKRTSSWTTSVYAFGCLFAINEGGDATGVCESAFRDVGKVLGNAVKPQVSDHWKGVCASDEQTATEIVELFRQLVGKNKNTVSLDISSLIVVQAGHSLLSAAREGDHQRVAECLKLGGGVDIADHNGKTALIYASARGDTTLVGTLLEAGANVDHAEKNQWSPLIYASSQGHVDFVETLFSAGVRVDASKRSVEASSMEEKRANHVAVVELLLKAGASVEYTDSGGMTALLHAATGADVEVVEVLVKGGARVAVTNDAGYTPLMLAAFKGHELMVERLLGFLKRDIATMRGRINALNANGESALVLACKHGHVNIVQTLIRHGARISRHLLSEDTNATSAPSPDLWDYLRRCQKRQDFRDQCLALMTASKSQLSVQRLSRLVRLITSVFEVSAMLTLVNLCEDPIAGRSLVAPVIDHVIGNGLVFDDITGFFFDAAVKHCEKAHYLPDAKLVTLSASLSPTSGLINSLIRRCKGISVKTNEPCRITKELNDDGFCKFHEPRAHQCRGKTRAGERCRIKWDLNNEQLCKYHVNQRSNPSFPREIEPEEAAAHHGSKKEVDALNSHCKGMSNTGMRCRTWRGLDADGFCSVHSFQAPTSTNRVHGFCRGVTQGRQCRVVWNLNASGYCPHHANQTKTRKLLQNDTTAGSQQSQCRGTTKQGLRCKIAWDLNDNGLCKYHKEQVVQRNLPMGDKAEVESEFGETKKTLETAAGLDNILLDSVVHIAREAHSVVMKCRADVEALTRRLQNLQSEVTVGIKLLACIESRMHGKMSRAVEVQAVRLSQLKDAVEGHLSELGTLHWESEKSSKLLRGAIAAIGSFVFATKIVDMKDPIVDYSDPVDILSALYQEEDVALFLADQSTKELPSTIQCQLEQHAISPTEFETVLREAIASARPEFLVECTKRKLTVKVVCCKSSIALSLMPKVDEDEAAMLDILTGLLEAVDSMWFTSSRVCEDSVRQNNAGRSRSGRGYLRGILQGVLGRPSLRVAPADSTSDNTASSENAVTSYIADFIDSSNEEEIFRPSKVCVLGSSADARASFIRSVTNQEPRKSREGAGVKLTDWSFHHKRHPTDDITEKFDVVFWDFADDEGFEAAHVLLFSEATIFMVCMDFELLFGSSVRGVLKPQDQLRWIHLILAHQLTAHIVFVDTSANLLQEMREEARSFLQSVYKATVDQFAHAFRSSQGAIEEYPRDDTPAFAQLRARIARVRNHRKATCPDGPRPWIQTCSPTARDNVTAEVVATNKFPLQKHQIEVVQVLRRRKEKLRRIASEDEKINEVFAREEDVINWVQTQLPFIDQVTIKATLKILHELGEVYRFHKTFCGPLKGSVCLDVELWLQYTYDTIRASRNSGVATPKTLERLPSWSNLRNVESTRRLTESLVAALIVFPSLRALKEEPDLVVPTFLPAPTNSTATDPLVLPDARARAFKWTREFVFQVDPPPCLFSQVFAASQNTLREYYGMDDEHFVQWTFGRDYLTCAVGEDFIIRVSVLRGQENQVGVDHERKATLKLDAIGAAQPRQPDWAVFLAVSRAIEAVLDIYQGILVFLDDPTWMPQYWAYADQIEERSHPREALVIDEMLYNDKICVVGPHYWGKTSLVQSLSANTPQLDHPKRTAGVDLVSSNFLEKDDRNVVARRHIVTFIDCAGEVKHKTIQALFYRYTTLFVVCVDLQAYATALEQARLVCDDDNEFNVKMNRFVKDKVLRWVDKVYFARADAEIVFAATKADVLVGRVSRIDEVRDHLFRQLKVHCERHTGNVRERLRALVDAPSFASKHQANLNVRGELQSTKWFAVSCVTQISVCEAQKFFECAIIRSSQRNLLPKSYARALTSIVVQRSKRQESVNRVEATIWTAGDLTSCLDVALPTADTAKRDGIIKLLHKTGDVMRYKDFKDPELASNKTIVEPQLVVDLACEIFDHKGPSEKIAHVSLENTDIFSLWATMKQRPRVMLEMKLVLRALRIVHQSKGKMKERSDLLVPSYWHHVITYENIHVGPKYLRYRRSQQSTHEHQVLFAYYLGNVFDEGFFERLALESYSPRRERRTYNGLIKYTADTSSAPDESGPTDHQFCQVWVQQESDDDSRYLVCLEAVAATPFVERIWGPFETLWRAIEKVLDVYYPQPRPLLYAIKTPPVERESDTLVMKDKDQVGELVEELDENAGPDGIKHNHKWLPPKLDWYAAMLEERNRTEEVVDAINA